ncbi:MAG: FecR family protein [Myxococcales bacterium]
MLTTMVAASAALCGCGDDAATRAGAEAPTNDVMAAAAASALVSQVGIEAGGIQHSEGALAVLAGVDGSVEVRRLGEEAFGAAKPHQALYLGDQVRVGDHARATVLFADQSTAEIAEVSTLSIGSRVSTADPASSAAVLGGVARFSVTPRMPGEGPFVVFTSAGIVATKGTVFGVGVAADGDARVGVEEGALSVAGAAALNAPITLEANHAVALEGAGTLAAPVAFREDNWGAWRDQAEAGLNADATIALHGDAMAKLASELEASYGVVGNLSAPLAKFETTAAADAQANATPHYEATLPEAALDLEASYLTALRLEYLSQAYLSHAVLAGDLYVRHPDVEAWAKVEPRVQAAVLWPKRFDLVASAYFEPLRFSYYLHHPRGRMNATFVGVVVPEFYAKVTPPAVPSADLDAKLKFKFFTPPTPKFTASARALWIGAPSLDWQAKASANVAPPRGKVAFYMRPPKLAAKAILGAEVKGRLATVFAVKPPRARGELDAKWGLQLGHAIHVNPPNLQAAAEARASWNVDAPELDAAAVIGTPGVDAHHALDLHGPKAKLEAKAKAKLDADAKLEANGKALAAAAGDAKGQGKARAGVKLKGPENQGAHRQGRSQGQRELQARTLSGGARCRR